MKQIPLIRDFMTLTPIVIPSAMSAGDAAQLMRKHNIRHLPVERGGKLAGLVSDRDLKAASSLDNFGHLPVEAIMTMCPYTVKEHARVDQVVQEMANHKYGSAIVVGSEGGVVGIFTSTDALHLLASLVQETLVPIDWTHISPAA